jgi:hypothetical protein
MKNYQLTQAPGAKAEMMIRKPVAEVFEAFIDPPDSTTFVSITETGFSGDGDEIVKQALESTGGFTWVLAGLKALLEHNIHLNLVADRFPEGLEQS